MEIPSQVVIDVLTYLLPGFIAAAILYNLTPSPRPVPFERTVQALIFTMLVQVSLFAVRATLIALGEEYQIGAWSHSVEVTWSVALGAGLGVCLAFLSNSDKLHRLLRWLGITKQTSYSSEWYGALAQNEGYVVLHLSGQRRLYGWPEEWPSTPREGHWVMSRAEWLAEGERIPLDGVEKVILRTEDVEMVELMSVMRNSGEESAHG